MIGWDRKIKMSREPSVINIGTEILKCIQPLSQLVAGIGFTF